MRFNIGKLTPFIFLAIFPCMAIAQGNSNSGSNGQPFQDLQAQIDELRAIVNNELIEIAVDCTGANSGDFDSINDALASVSDLTNPVTINISGICAESAFISRDEVTLRGTNSDNDGISSQTWIAAWVTEGASQIVIEELSLSGGFAGMSCLNGASALGRGLDIAGNGGGSGVLAFHGGNCEIIGSTISDHGNGVNVGTNSGVILRGTIVENSTTNGAHVNTGGTLSLERLDFGAVSASSIIRENGRGVNVMTNGVVRALQVDIYSNDDVGIWVHSGGSLVTEAYSGSVNITDNAQHGIVIDKLTSAFFGGYVFIEGNGESGVQCYGTVSVFDFDNPLFVQFSGNGYNGYHSCDEYPATIPPEEN